MTNEVWVQHNNVIKIVWVQLCDVTTSILNFKNHTL